MAEQEIEGKAENDSDEDPEPSTQVYFTQEWKQEDLECCCCLYEYDLMTHPPIVSSSCSHSLCLHCIAKIWTRSSGRYSCPLCRALIPCPESINYSLLASFHRHLPLKSPSQLLIPPLPSSHYVHPTPPFVFSLDEIETAISSTGRLKGLSSTSH
jgi:hypothetical protein